MNRVIKFRAWNDRKKKMIFGPTDDNPSPSWIIALPQVINSEIPVMQFTGVMDANGKEIYEGDVIRVSDFLDKVKVIGVPLERMVVEYNAPYAEYLLTGKGFSVPLGMEQTKLVVIGNVWENPKLVAI